MTFGGSLKRILDDHETTQKQLADGLKLDYGYLSRIIRDKANFNPSREFIARIADALNCSESEKRELLTEAGRVDKELEDIARDATANPTLHMLFKSLPELDETELESLRRRVEKIRGKKQESKDK